MVLETNCIKQLVKKTGTDYVTTIMASKTPWQWESHCNCTSKLWYDFMLPLQVATTDHVQWLFTGILRIFATLH